jgi:hypothetical protein
MQGHNAGPLRDAVLVPTLHMDAVAIDAHTGTTCRDTVLPVNPRAWIVTTA